MMNETINKLIEDEYYLISLTREKMDAFVDDAPNEIVSDTIYHLCRVLQKIKRINAAAGDKVV